MLNPTTMVYSDALKSPLLAGLSLLVGDQVELGEVDAVQREVAESIYLCVEFVFNRWR
jgi:hypothetical protein